MERLKEDSSNADMEKTEQANLNLPKLELPKQYNHQEVEAKWIDAWQKSDIYKWNENRPRSETFVVDTPPPTVSGSLHVGHVFSYTHQDIIVRQRRMMGYNIFFPMGYDDNGLPTERRVQNYFNVRCDPYVSYKENLSPKNNKKEAPELVSRQNFIELCHKVTKEDEAAFKSLWQQIGLSVDWSLEYATIDDHCRKTSQYSFLDLLSNGHAYSVESPTLWDVDFQTAVAQAEVVDKTVPGAFHFIRFAVENLTEKNTTTISNNESDKEVTNESSFVIATTRPELLPACVAVIAHPDDDRYKHLFGKHAITPIYFSRVPIIADTRANPEKGTGILMVCTFGDATDIEWWREYKLPLRQIIGKDGRLLPIEFGKESFESVNPVKANESYSLIVGKNTKQARAKIIELLLLEEHSSTPKEGKSLISEPKPLEHAVKFYEKGDRPLEIITTRQWFVKIADKKDQLSKQGEKIKWHPHHMKTRYDNWVDGLNQDWCFSRQRYFGVPFPVWYKLDGNARADYSNPIVPKLESLPIDPVVQTPTGFEESMRGKPFGFIGDPDVMDTWATSSVTPQINSHWVDNQSIHNNTFPMDLRPQSHEIIRTWAFYTIVKALLHKQDIPWQHVIISGWILDPDRKKMSKSQGNVVTPHDILEKYSSDAVRYWAARARLGVDTAFDETLFHNGKKLTTKLFNATKFVATHILNEPSVWDFTLADITHPLDRGFLSKLRSVLQKNRLAFSSFEFANALSETETFFWSQFCDNYLELIKERAYRQFLDNDKKSALATLNIALSIQLRLFAPILPYITEELWSWLYAKHSKYSPSIHNAIWPHPTEISNLFEVDSSSYDTACLILEKVRKAKGEAKVSMKAPVSKIVISGISAMSYLITQIENDVKASTSVNEIIFEVSDLSELKIDVIL